MNTFVIDASIAVKWVVDEAGTEEALSLRRNRLQAPDLLASECTNILWKKVRRHELSRPQALFAARLLQSADVELLPTRALLETATRVAIELDHPAYDCVYIALAMTTECPFVTADERLLRKLNQGGRGSFRDRIISLHNAARRQPT